jgi:hypothetical protein
MWNLKKLNSKWNSTYQRIGGKGVRKMWSKGTKLSYIGGISSRDLLHNIVITGNDNVQSFVT